MKVLLKMTLMEDNNLLLFNFAKTKQKTQKTKTQKNIKNKK